MANPGYPPMGGPMQPTGPGSMGPMGPMGPMGGMGMQPARQGTSHIVPVVVAAGLAVGVFCGLLFGLGTRHEAAPSRGSTGAKQSEESQIQTAQVSMGTKLPDRPRTGSAGTPAVATGSAGSAAAGAAGAAGTGSNTGSAGSTAGPGPGKLKVEIQPDSAAQAAKVLVDGIQITGTEVDIPFDPGVAKKSVKVVVRVPGYKDMEKMIEVESEGSASLSFDLKGVRLTAAPDDGSKAGGNAGGGGNTGGGGTAGGAGTGGAGSKGTGGGSKGTGGKGTGKGSGKGSSGLIDI
jgi:hypothetical protein